MGNTVICPNGRCQSEYNPKRLMEGRGMLLHKCHNCGTKYNQQQLKQHALYSPNKHLSSFNPQASSFYRRETTRKRGRRRKRNVITGECSRSTQVSEMHNTIEGMITTQQKFNEKTSIKTYDALCVSQKKSKMHLSGKLNIFISEKMRQYITKTSCVLHNDEFKLHVSNDNGLIYTISVDDIMVDVDLIKTPKFKIFCKHNPKVFDEWKQSIQELQAVEYKIC